MSGLFAGLQLRARGFAVDIYERVDSDRLFWGQDRLELVMRALGGWRSA